MDNKTVSIKEKQPAENENIVRLTHEYTFEVQKISEIDMSGMEDLTADDMIKASKVLNANGNVSVITETNLEYDLIIASFATGKPIEFFKALKPRDAIRIKNKVTSFFFGEE